MTKRYSDDFKANIIKLYQEEKRSKASLTKEYDVHPTTVGNWINHVQPIRLPDGGTVSATEFKDLQKKYQEVLEENEILKAAAVLLGKR